MAKKAVLEAQNPLILRCHRLMEAFAKSDDERDFYIDRLEGFLIYVDLDKSQAEIDTLQEEIKNQSDRFCLIPKLSFYETKKIMEGFVNEKVYDIDTKEKLLDIIQSKEARENFLEFIFDHHTEMEKWQMFYQERSRIRIIEWLRANHFHFVFEEDLELPRQMNEKLKQFLFDPKVGKDILAARKALALKAKTYYSNEALNPRPKRGRPPKQAIKPELEPQVSVDIYTTVPPSMRPFLFTPEINTSSTFSAFSSKFGSDEGLERRNILRDGPEGTITEKLAALKSLSSKWIEKDPNQSTPKSYQIDGGFDDDEDDEDDDDEFEDESFSKKPSKKAKAAKASPKKGKSASKETAKGKSGSKSASTKAVTKAAQRKSSEKKAESKAKPVIGKGKEPALSKNPKKRIMPTSKGTTASSKKK